VNDRDPAKRLPRHPDELFEQRPFEVGFRETTLAPSYFSFVTICHDLTPTVLEIFRPDAVEDGCGPEFIDAIEPAWQTPRNPWYKPRFSRP